MSNYRVSGPERDLHCRRGLLRLLQDVHGTRPTSPTVIDVVPREIGQDSRVLDNLCESQKAYIVTALSWGRLGGAKWLAWTGIQRGSLRSRWLFPNSRQLAFPPTASTTTSLLSKSALRPMMTY